jgi:hypothetical protein
MLPFTCHKCKAQTLMNGLCGSCFRDPFKDYTDVDAEKRSIDEQILADLGVVINPLRGPAIRPNPEPMIMNWRSDPFALRPHQPTPPPNRTMNSHDLEPYNRTSERPLWVNMILAFIAGALIILVLALPSLLK